LAHDKVWVCRRIDIRTALEGALSGAGGGHMSLTLEALEWRIPDQAQQWLTGLYEHSPWVVALALKQRPFRAWRT